MNDQDQYHQISVARTSRMASHMVHSSFDSIQICSDSCAGY